MSPIGSRLCFPRSRAAAVRIWLRKVARHRILCSGFAQWHWSRNTPSPCSAAPLLSAARLRACSLQRFFRRIGWRVNIYERSSIELIGRGVGIFAHIRNCLRPWINAAPAGLTSVSPSTSGRSTAKATSSPRAAASLVHILGSIAAGVIKGIDVSVTRSGTC